MLKHVWCMKDYLHEGYRLKAMHLHLHHQGCSHEILSGPVLCARVSRPLGVSGVMSPRKILDFGPSETVSDQVLSKIPMLFTIAFTGVNIPFSFIF